MIDKISPIRCNKVEFSYKTRAVKYVMMPDPANAVDNCHLRFIQAMIFGDNGLVSGFLSFLLTTYR